MTSLIKKALILSIALATCFTSYVAYNNYTYFSRDLRGYMGLYIGSTKDETLYTLGIPTTVLDPPEFDASWGGKISRSYQVDGNDSINKIPAGKNYRDYLSWAFDGSNGTRIDIDFDTQSMLISSIGCYSNLKTECPKIFGISTGISEDKVLEILGKPTDEILDGVTKKLEYDDIGLDVLLSKKISYYIVKRRLLASEFPWFRFIGSSINLFGTIDYW